MMKRRTYKKGSGRKKISVLLLLVLLGGSGLYFRLGREVAERPLSSLIGQVRTREDQGESLPTIVSSTGVLLDLTTGEVVASKKPDKKAYPASLTKMMTAYVVIQQLSDLNELVEVPSSIYDDLVAEGASLAGFYAGEVVPAKELLYGMMLPSGAEATLALAIHLAGSEAAFVELMNETAKDLGMTQTNFVNATGLHDRKQYSTATDLSKLLLGSLKAETFREIFTTKEHQYINDYHPEGLYMGSRVFQNLADSTFEKGELLGGKTGFTNEAGQCLASLARVNDKEYILVTMGADGNQETADLHIEDALTVYQWLD